ncbi:MAG: hypothetical protein JW801_05175, partial [Bacteroidales bacterium]|nr:hypothetical protein [Bacteroidales bacterium]
YYKLPAPYYGLQACSLYYKLPAYGFILLLSVTLVRSVSSPNVQMSSIDFLSNTALRKHLQARLPAGQATGKAAYSTVDESRGNDNDNETGLL